MKLIVLIADHNGNLQALLSSDTGFIAVPSHLRPITAEDDGKSSIIYVQQDYSGG